MKLFQHHIVCRNRAEDIIHRDDGIYHTEVVNGSCEVEKDESPAEYPFPTMALLPP